MKTLKYLFGVMLAVSIVFGAVSCNNGDEDDKPDFSADFPEAQRVDGKITIFAKFEVAPCGDVVLPGSYLMQEGSETAWETDPTKLLKFESAGTINGKNWGAEGWWKVTVDLSPSAVLTYGDNQTAVLGGKPVHLEGGEFDWSFQMRYNDETDVEVKSGDVDVRPGYPGEGDIYFLTNATVALVFKGWRNDPCNVVRRNYTLNVTVPEDTPADAVVYVAGGMNGWSATASPLTRSGSTYSITFNNVREGTEYKYLLNGSWDFEEMAAAEEEGQECAPGISGNRVLGATTTVNDVVLNWKGVTTCIPGEVRDITFVVTVPVGTPADAEVYIAGDMNGWSPTEDKLTKNEDGTWSITFEGITSGMNYKYLLNGNWDFEELAATDEDEDCAPAIDNRVTIDEDTIEDTVLNWNGITAERCE